MKIPSFAASFFDAKAVCWPMLAIIPLSGCKCLAADYRISPRAFWPRQNPLESHKTIHSLVSSTKLASQGTYTHIRKEFQIDCKQQKQYGKLDCAECTH